MTRDQVGWAERGGSLAESSGKCYNFITAINSGGKRGDKLSRRNETIGGHKLCARKWHIKCGVYVGADAYNANVGRQWSWQQLIATSTSAHTRLVLVTALHATSYMLHAGPDPSHVLYFTVYMILALGQLLQVLYSAILCNMLLAGLCIVSHAYNEWKTQVHWLRNSVYIQLKVKLFNWILQPTSAH